MKKPKTFVAEGGKLAVTIRAESALLLDDYEGAQALARELGYRSLKEYLDLNLPELVYSSLVRDHEERVRKPVQW